MFKSAIKYFLQTLCKLKMIKQLISLCSPITIIPNYFSFIQINSKESIQLDTIPSQTTKGERQFLYHYFSSFWSGDSNVLEIGPFLGGTTRAIALGMMNNPQKLKNSRLYTYDRFEEYFELEPLQQYLEPLIESHQITSDDVKSLGEKSQFKQIFTTIHKNHDYYDCITPSNHGVPDHPNEESKGHWMELPKDFKTNAIFIDGCKSWYGTKYFMKTISHAVEPGAIYIFQDYGWFTCFWLVTFLSIFEDFFRLVGHVDNTYIFKLIKPLSIKTIDQYFPNSPKELGSNKLVNIIDKEIAKANSRQDPYAELRHTLHKAAASAYVNNLDDARNFLRQAELLPNANEHKKVIEMAWKSPTYTPEAPILLGK